MKKTLQNIFALPLLMAVMLMCSLNAQAKQIDLNNVNATAKAMLGTWSLDPKVLLEELPEEVSKAECYMNFHKDDKFDLQILITGEAEGILLDMNITVTGVWTLEKGGKLKLDDLKPQVELTDLKMPDSMKEEMKSTGLSEATLKQMFKEMFSEKAKTLIESDAFEDMGNTTILSLTETTMVFENDDDNVTLTKVE